MWKIAGQCDTKICETAVCNKWDNVNNVIVINNVQKNRHDKMNEYQ